METCPQLSAPLTGTTETDLECTLPSLVPNKARDWSNGGGGVGGHCFDHSPLIAELAGEAVQVVDILLGPHDHFEGRDELAARRAIPRHPKQPAGHKQKKSLSSCVSPPKSPNSTTTGIFTRMFISCTIT